MKRNIIFLIILVLFPLSSFAEGGDLGGGGGGVKNRVVDIQPK